jgi:hypothetical protein
MNNIIDLDGDLFRRIADYYWKELHTRNISIWTWLEEDYKAFRIRKYSKGGIAMEVKFEDPKLMTMFVLRWA